MNVNILYLSKGFSEGSQETDRNYKKIQVLKRDLLNKPAAEAKCL